MGEFTKVALAALGAVAFVAVAVLSRRWRRAGDHPHCRRCDFDLFGLPPESSRCPECGADLAAPRATVTGARRPARFAQAGALVAALACAGAAVWFGRGADWMLLRVRHMPTTWLVRHLDDGGRIAGLANAELSTRLQADGVDDGTRGRIAAGLWRVKAVARANVRAGDPLPIAVELGRPAAMIAGPFGPGAMNAARDARYQVWYRVEPARIVGVEPAGPARSGMWQQLLADFRMLGTSTAVPIPGDAPPGPIEVELTYAFRVIGPDERPSVVAGDGRRYEREIDADDPATAAWRQTVRVAANVLPRDTEDDVELVVDPAQRDAMRAAIRLGARGRGPTTGPFATTAPTDAVRIYGHGPSGAQIDLELDAMRVPVPLAADVFLRDPATGVEVAVAAVTYRPRWGRLSGNHTPETRRALAAWTSPTGTIIFRPSRRLARQDQSLDAIWGEEIVIERVPIAIERPPPSGDRP